MPYGDQPTGPTKPVQMLVLEGDCEFHDRGILHPGESVKIDMLIGQTFWIRYLEEDLTGGGDYVGAGSLLGAVTIIRGENISF